MLQEIETKTVTDQTIKLSVAASDAFSLKENLKGTPYAYMLPEADAAV